MIVSVTDSGASPSEPTTPYYRDDLARIHHLGFGSHAETCAPGVLALLAPVRDRKGLVVELGCGSGRLTRHLLDTGHRVVATDASPSMLKLARHHAPEAEQIYQLTLPDDPIPPADAIVSVGHVLNYLGDAEQVATALVAIGRALRPDGVMALDICDVQYGVERRDACPRVWRGDDWMLVTEFSVTATDRFVRCMTTLVRESNGLWRRNDERHDNVLIDTSAVPALLSEHGVEASVRSSFGSEELPAGLVAVVGRRSSTELQSNLPSAGVPSSGE